MAVTKARSRRPRSTPEERAEKQATRVAELKGQFDAAVAQLVTTDSWRTMLDGAIHLHRYSFRNMLLLLSQCPQATQVAGYREWQKRERHVRQGERALWILAPMTVRDTDSDTAKGSTDQDDDRRRVLYRPVPVWDITQTARNDGKPDTVAPGAPRLTGDAPAKMWDNLAAHATSLGYTLEQGDTGTANGWTNPDTRTVRVSDTLNDAHAAKTLTHEVAHIQCEHVTDMDEYQQHRGLMETEAESVAYVVCAVFGLDSAAYSVPYVAGWAGTTPEDVHNTIKAAGNRVMTAAKTILAAVTLTDHTDDATDDQPEQ
ncbi:ArdC family protein [Actinacidiphila soli]|uniref:ArdC family protein n=1 Tax=Actinacidiphila soli TaxID=2487275 RepID=UPI0019D1D7CD|nr:ArdC family protein [Actinacidiphila soli]